jgi:hypothetical protein
METLTSKYNDLTQSNYDITPEMEAKFNKAVIEIL